MAEQNRKRTKSPYTVDRDMPGAFEGETITRRRLMTGTAHGMGALAAGAFALPAIGFALGPVFERQKWQWQDLGPLADFSSDTYSPKTFEIVAGIGEAGYSTVYVRRYNEAIDGPKRDKYDDIVAVSTRCMHLGCAVRFVQAAERFVCPCHGGVYDFKGSVIGGPPVRPLDRFYTQQVDGRVQIGPRYSVNSEFTRFSPRDPGEPLDGIGQFMYPARFSTPKLSDPPTG
ncbi:MAG: ubiquinol-cytochrome c reductase iron-sulfur subunit [Solirubrobacterales bacterium]|nr:ubiquinol-cytochrome c reductase iron-sulfur subunit [Solirubrobacterales bacterium]